MSKGKPPKNKQQLESAESHKIELSVPWGGGPQGQMFRNSNVYSESRWGEPENEENSAIELAKLEAQTEFVKERTRAHEAYIAEQAKTRRLALILAFLLIIAALSAVLFAPPGREMISYWIGATLLIFAAGASGYGSIWAKAPGFSVGAKNKD